MHVLIDTNMLLVPGQFGVDVFSELSRIINSAYCAVTLQENVHELEKIAASGNSKDAKSAALGLKLVEMKLDVIPSDKPGDEAIIEFAKQKPDCIVCTNDKELRDRLLGIGIRVICMREKQKLGFC